MQVKNKFKLLVQKDTTVSLLSDEIHLKPSFDHKDVGLSDNSNEATTGGFDFIWHN